MIRATLFREWELEEFAPKQTFCPAHYVGKALVPAGTYELQRIPNPLGLGDADWLVLKDRPCVGMAEGAWNDWRNGMIATREGHRNFGLPIDWGVYEIRVEYLDGDAPTERVAAMIADRDEQGRRAAEARSLRDALEPEPDRTAEGGRIRAAA